mmetsp:Transcript_25276/g.84984  ORF Transcript_25276/g.84984 Transcript_25276/m.84984 type:complete len:263 (-) Transcript_25276:22-810(-)
MPRTPLRLLPAGPESRDRFKRRMPSRVRPLPRSEDGHEGCVRSICRICRVRRVRRAARARAAGRAAGRVEPARRFGRRGRERRARRRLRCLPRLGRRRDDGAGAAADARRPRGRGDARGAAQARPTKAPSQGAAPGAPVAEALSGHQPSGVDSGLGAELRRAAPVQGDAAAAVEEPGAPAVCKSDSTLHTRVARLSRVAHSAQRPLPARKGALLYGVRPRVLRPGVAAQAQAPLKGPRRSNPPRHATARGRPLRGPTPPALL